MFFLALAESPIEATPEEPFEHKSSFNPVASYQPESLFSLIENDLHQYNTRSIDIQISLINNTDP